MRGGLRRLFHRKRVLDEVIKAIRAVHDGGSPLDPKAARALLESRRSRDAGPQLTDREREVLLLVRDGLANKQIARRLEHWDGNVEVTAESEAPGRRGRSRFPGPRRVCW